jgi:hypothetical protein
LFFRNFFCVAFLEKFARWRIRMVVPEKFLTVARTDKDRAETSLALCNVSAQFFA